MIKTFILKHKIGILSLIFFMAATILFILFILDDLPYYESLTELNASYFIWIGMTVLCLGVSNYLLILSKPKKPLKKNTKFTLSISSLFFLIAISFIMIEFLMVHINLPPLGDQPTFDEAWAYLEAKTQIYSNANRVGLFGDISLITGFIMTIIGISNEKNESKESSHLPLKSI